MTPYDRQQLRYEVKFAAYATEYAVLSHWLHAHEAGFRTPYPARRINNVYFDTWDCRAYSENLAGVSRRSKLRYRWYGEQDGPQPGVLEIKHKKNQLGWKQRFDVPMLVWTPGWGWDDVRSSLAEQTPPAARICLQTCPQTMFINRYLREYFVSGDGQIRATIDTAQQVFDQRLRSMPNLRNAAIMQDTVVMEFKFAPALRPLAVALLADIPVRLGRYSKYMNAVRSIAMV